MKPHSEKFLQQRRFYMVLPLLVTPFITMIFWALGGGSGTQVQAQPFQSGINMELPGAHFNKEEELWDKFSLYEQAKRDSLKKEEAKRNDPYYVMATLEEQKDTVPATGNFNTSLGSKDRYAQIQNDEKEITKKLELLTKHLSEEESKPRIASNISQPVSFTVPQPTTAASEDVQRLEKMMQLINEEGSSDPEMQQIDQMLEKILDIQHPDRVKEKLKTQSTQLQSMTAPVTLTKTDEPISLMSSNTTLEDNDVSSLVLVKNNYTIGFYGLEEDENILSEEANAITAVIHDNQEVVAGSIVKLRLLDDIDIKGHHIGKDQFIYGTCSIEGERLTIQISSIRDEQSLFPIAMEVYDLDGLPGIYVPGAITRDVAKQSASQSVSGMQMLSMDNSLEMQAASAGIQAAKGIFSKKVKLIKVNLKAGYQILLKDKNATKI